MKKLIALFLFSWISFSQARVELCNFSFLANSQEDPSTLFIAYLDFLNEENALEVNEFEEVLVRLESGELINPFEAKEVSKENESYGRVFQDYINVGVDEERVKTYLESIVKKEKQTQSEIDRTKKEVKDTFSPIQFGEIIPDSSKGDFGIDYSFEVMVTPVTNAHWNSIFEKPSLSLGWDIFDRPKTNINYYSQAVFADILSAKNGFEPVFHMESKELRKGTSAFGGDLIIETDRKRWKMPSSIIYQSGYRLPTIEEQYLVFQKARDFIGEKDFEKRVGDFAHLSHNSNNQTSPVATKKAYFFNNIKFYDIIGNIRETSLKESLNPLGATGAFYDFQSHTGSYQTHPKGLLDYAHFEEKTARMDNLGFRLVRTLKK